MAFTFADRVREQVSAFSGTGAVSLPGVAVSGFQTFLAGWGASGTGLYCISMGAQYEVGFGTINVGGSSLARTEPIGGSSGPATLVNFSAGTLDCWGDAPADFIGTRDTEDYLINGNGHVAQSGVGSTADDVYSHDQWYALTQTAALTTSQLTDVEDGVPQMIRLTQGQASAQRMGYAQIIEAQRCKKLRGKRVTFGGRLRYSNAAAVNFAILEWTGTADAPTSDVVNDWTNGTFTAGNFFNSTTLTVRAVGTLTPSAATLTDFRVSATLGSSFNNLILMIWTSGTAAQNSTLDFVAQLKRGFVVAPYVFRPFDQEILLCQRYFWKTFAYATAPAQNVGVQTGEIMSWTIRAGAQLHVFHTLQFPIEMRASPTMVLFNPAAANGQVRNESGAADCTSSGTFALTARSYTLLCTLDAGAGVGYIVGVHATAAARL